MEITRSLAKSAPHDLTSPDDWLAVAARTDPDAFASLYQTYVERVYRYVVVRGSSEHDAEDLTALTFERALRGIGGYHPGGVGVLPWLLRIARNASIDAHRRRVARASIPLEQWPLVVDHSPTPEQAAIAAEQRREVLGQLAALPQAQRDAIALRYAAGLSCREIAAVLGKSEAATKKTLSRALEALREATRHDE